MRPDNGPRRLPPVEETEEVAQSGAGVERHERRVVAGSGDEHQERVVHDVALERRLWLVKISNLIWFCLGVVEVLIGLRVLLKLIAANPANDFAHFIYDAAGALLGPFFGLTSTPSSHGSVLEVPSLIAMLVYALLAWGLVRLVWLLLDRPPTRHGATYDRFRS